jgi:hypothetical protein
MTNPFWEHRKIAPFVVSAFIISSRIKYTYKVANPPKTSIACQTRYNITPIVTAVAALAGGGSIGAEFVDDYK